MVTGAPIPARPSPESQVNHHDATDAELAAGFAAGDEHAWSWPSALGDAGLHRRAAGTEQPQRGRGGHPAGVRQCLASRTTTGRTTKLPGWLIGICRHRIVDRQRARGRDLRLVQAVTSEADVRFQHESITTLIDRVVLADEIQRLPHPRGTILQLAFWEGRSYPQIAEQLELPLGTVKSHARRALLHCGPGFRRSRREPPRQRAARRSGTRPNG